VTQAWTSTGALFALALSVGCAYSASDGEQLEAEVYKLQTQLQEALAQLERLQEQQRADSEQLSQLASTLGDLNLSARRNDADFGVQVEELQIEVARLRGAFDALDGRTSALESDASRSKAEFDLKLENLETQQRIEQSGSAAERERARKEAERQAELLDQPQRALDEARRLVDRGAPADARKLLRELVLRNEKQRAFRRYAPSAQLLIADTYFAQGDYQQAAAEYNQVRKDHGSSSKVADAFLGLGRCFQRLDLPDDAKLFLETAVKKYPRSAAAKEARKILRTL
jgi:TolA-binding protein